MLIPSQLPIARVCEGDIYLANTLNTQESNDNNNRKAHTWKKEALATESNPPFPLPNLLDLLIVKKPRTVDCADEGTEEGYDTLLAYNSIHYITPIQSRTKKHIYFKNFLVQCKGVVRKIRWISCDHFIYKHTQRPPIHSCPMTLS